ncbi:MAG TPA: hypothetical protein VFO05_01445 [Candidatus Limnocylindrales bacterium]|nr:hypothetical protein [Candidatus Limnocylindrales bacterium]
MTRSATFFAAVLVSIGRPAWWLMALATFLLRGGIVVVVLPIMTLPSALALSNMFGPIVLPLALGRIEPAIVLGPLAVVIGLLAWLILGGRIAAAIDIALVREASVSAVDEGVAPTAVLPGSPRLGPSELAWRVLAIRLVAWLPLALAVGFGVARIVEVTYIELTRPTDVATPLIVRVAGDVVSHLGLIVLAWALGEVVGGVATRRATLTSDGHGTALAWAVGTTAARPLSWLVPWIATTAVLAIVLGATLAAAAFTWARVVDGLSDRLANPMLALLTMLLFVALWLAAMLLGGAILAVRSAAQTFEHVRRLAREQAGAAGGRARSGVDGAGTFGGPTRSRPGDWSANDEGGSL